MKGSAVQGCQTKLGADTCQVARDDVEVCDNNIGGAELSLNSDSF